MQIRASDQLLDTPSKEAIYFFFQCLQEKLFDTSIDSYKAPALNTFGRTLELQRIAQRNYQASLSKETLAPFVQELAWSIDEDAVLSSSQRALCRVHAQAIERDLDDPKRIALGLAGLRITLGDYFSAIKNQVRACVALHTKRKSQLADLAASFVVQAELHGFPRRHTYHVVQIALRGPLRRGYDDPVALLDEFFSRFDPLKMVKYDCFFLASADCERFSRLLAVHHIRAFGDELPLENLNRRQQEVISQKNEATKFYGIESHEAHCAVSAHEFCLRQFRSFASKLEFADHKLELSVSSLALIRNNESEKIIIVRDRQDPMQCVVDEVETTEEEALLVAEALSGDHFSHASASRLERAIRYHADALRSESVENKLVDMWAALEGLLSAPKKGGSRIEYFAESLLPSITLAYPQKILASLFNIFESEQHLISHVERAVNADVGQFGKFVRFMLCEEHASSREESIPLMRGNPLLLNRCWSVTERFSTRENVLRTLQNHRVKVKWNLERIYAMRNTIMHDASALPHLSTLVENLHTYLDTLIRALLRTGLSALESRISTEAALQYLSSWEKHRFQALADRSLDPKSALTEENVWDTVFGANFVLAPTDAR